MSEDLQDLLAREGHDDAETLMDWARERAAELVPNLEEDEELGPLLAAGGEAGEAPPRPERSEADAAADAEAEAHRVEQVALAARREASNAAPLPPIPVAVPADPTDELDLDEIEELDMEELEMVEEDDGEEAGDEDAQDDAASDADSAANSDAEPDSATGEQDEIAGAEPEESQPADHAGEPEEAVSFGPPDGNEHVPEWKAALLSTQTETDQEAAERVKEASTAGPLPEMEFPQGEEERRSGRLEAEDDEISQHSVDLSDLDADDE